MPRARHAGLPTHLSSDQLVRLLQRPAAPGPASYRDRAILSLLAGLSLRAAKAVASECFRCLGGRREAPIGVAGHLASTRQVHQRRRDQITGAVRIQAASKSKWNDSAGFFTGPRVLSATVVTFRGS